jgi:hypothetical protein
VQKQYQWSFSNQNVKISNLMFRTETNCFRQKDRNHKLQGCLIIARKQSNNQTNNYLGSRQTLFRWNVGITRVALSKLATATASQICIKKPELIITQHSEASKNFRNNKRLASQLVDRDHTSIQKLGWEEIYLQRNI